MADETHEKIDNEVGEDKLYELVELSLDENKQHKRAFENKLRIIYYTKRPNAMHCIHDTQVNNIVECNSLHYIINPSRLAKNISSHYSPILD